MVLALWMRCVSRSFLRQWWSYLSVSIGISNMRETEWLLLRMCTGKNNGFPFLDILGYLKNTHKKPKFGILGTWLGIPWLGLVSLCQIWDFYGYSLNTQKYPKMGIRYFFLWCCIAMVLLWSVKEIELKNHTTMLF